MRATAAQTTPVCQCHGAPVADGAALCADGTAELVEHLTWLTTRVSRADREPPTETIQVKIPGVGILDQTVIARHHYGRQPSTAWDTPSGEMRNLPRILEESAAHLAVRTTHARLATHTTDPPIPIHLRSMNDAGRLREVIARWATALSGVRVPLDAPWDVSTVADWLIDSRQDIRQQEWAGLMLTEIRKAITRATAGVDVAPTRHYLGICRAGHIPAPTPGEPEPPADAPPPSPGCQGQVFALETATVGHCNTCRAAYSVTERHDERDRSLTGARLTAVQIDRLTTELGHRIPRTTINRWADSGRIQGDGSGTPRYLYDEVCSLAAEAAAAALRRAERKAQTTRRSLRQVTMRDT